MFWDGVRLLDRAKVNNKMTFITTHHNKMLL